eukprot:34296_1
MSTSNDYGTCHFGHVLRKSGGIGPLTDGHRPYGFACSTIMPVAKIILGIVGFIKSVEYLSNMNELGTENRVSAAGLVAASFYLIIEGINQFVDETTNTFIEIDMKEDENHSGKLVWLGVFQIFYTCMTIYPFYWAIEVLSADDGFDGADSFVFVLGLMLDAIINLYESIMIMFCKRCCVKTWCEVTDCCCCCDTTCGYMCFLGGGLTEISKRNICYGFLTTTIVPMTKIFFGIIAIGLIPENKWSDDDTATVASRAGFIASAGYIISDGVNSFTDQFIEGAIENKARCSLTVAGIVEILYTCAMLFFMNGAYTAYGLSDNKFDQYAGFMLLIALGIDVFINIYEIFLVFCCRSSVLDKYDEW